MFFLTQGFFLGSTQHCQPFSCRKYYSVWCNNRLKIKTYCEVQVQLYKWLSHVKMNIFFFSKFLMKSKLNVKPSSTIVMHIGISFARKKSLLFVCLHILMKACQRWKYKLDGSQFSWFHVKCEMCHSSFTAFHIPSLMFQLEVCQKFCVKHRDGR